MRYPQFFFDQSSYNYCKENMKDILNHEGKIYISARRASEISDYSSDYIGQLCRSQKLDCRMVGRSWFVTEESLAKHKESVLKDEIYRNRIQNLRGRKFASSDMGVNGKTIAEENTDELIGDSNIIVHSSSDSRENLVIDEEITKDVRSEPLVYSFDDRPLMPVLSIAKDEADRSSNKSINDLICDIPIPQEIEQRKSEIEPNTRRNTISTVSRIHSLDSSYVSRSLILRRVLMSGASVFVLAILVAGTISLTSDSNAPSNEANVFSSIGSFISNGMDSVLSIFRHEEQLAVREKVTNPLIGDVPQVEQGIVVIPRQDEGSIDAETIQRIQNSFSDEVDVRPDGSGTAGIITPVFRQAKGADYVYVMVPVKNSSSP